MLLVNIDYLKTLLLGFGLAEDSKRQFLERERCLAGFPASDSCRQDAFGERL
jgi:hypothetical protein